MDSSIRSFSEEAVFLKKVFGRTSTKKNKETGAEALRGVVPNRT
jgi:hypothetical protein